MKNTLQLNYWTIGGFDGAKDPETALKEAKEMGYDGLELTFGAGQFAQGVGEKRCAAIRKTADALGMAIKTVASGNYWSVSLTSPDAEERRKAVAFAKEQLQVAKWVGAETILVVPGAVAVPWDPSRPVVPYEQVWELATASIKECAATAESLGVNLGVENVWNWFLADPVAMRSFVDQFGSERIGVYFDVANCLINGYPEHWITLLGARIKAIHIKNFSRSDCGGGIHGFGDDLEKGDVNFPAVRAALKTIHYAGPLTAEMIPFSRLPDLVLPDMELARATAPKMKKLFGR